MKVVVLLVLLGAALLLPLLNLGGETLLHMSVYSATLVHFGALTLYQMLRGDVHGFFGQFVDMDLENHGRHMVTDGTTMMDVLTEMYVTYANRGAWGLALRFLESQTQVEILQENDEQPKRCYGIFGCVKFTKKWYHKQYRPYNTLPMGSRDIQVKFNLTQNNKTREIRSSPDQSDLENFNASLPTVLYIHGYMSSTSDRKATQLKEALQKFDNVNYISVDWQIGARQIYTVSMCNTLLVAMETTHLVRQLQNLSGLSLQYVHIVGHSMGAHIGGYIGSWMPGLGRITGLDPAKPGFDHMPAEVRLDPSDARYVQVIHTDMGSEQWNLPGFGVQGSSGHVDIHVNGGFLQPDCRDAARFLEHVLVGNLACQHNKAADVFLATIPPVSSCQTIAHECSSYQRYTSGLCPRCDRGNSTCVQVGYRSSARRLAGRTGVTMFLRTAIDGSSCQAHYSLQFRVVASPTATPGRLVVSMTGRHGNISTTLPQVPRTTTKDSGFSLGAALAYMKPIINWLIELLTDYQNISTNDYIIPESGKNYSFLLASDINLGEVDRVLLTWTPRGPEERKQEELAIHVADVMLTPMTHLYSAPTLVIRSEQHSNIVTLPAHHAIALPVYRQ